jgi:hypothetical protein
MMQLIVVDGGYSCLAQWLQSCKHVCQSFLLNDFSTRDTTTVPADNVILTAESAGIYDNNRK